MNKLVFIPAFAIFLMREQTMVGGTLNIKNLSLLFVLVEETPKDKQKRKKQKSPELKEGTHRVAEPVLFCCERFEPQSHFKSRLSLIVRVNVVLNRTVVVDGD